MMDDSSSGVSAVLKRPREPLSDAEDNVLLSPDLNDGQKRRRLDEIGQENRTPKASCSRRLAELEVKGDTPAIQSVRSRVQQLTQHREGGPLLAQRCLSDPGSGIPSIFIQEKIFKEHLLGEAEFSQRVERFRAANLQPSPARSLAPANPSSLTLSRAVTCIQQRLQGSTTPSSKQASRLRQEREEELRLLCSQPISDNAWLKRSMSDSSLNEAEGDEEDSNFPEGFLATKDGSFTQAPAFSPGPTKTADDALIRHSDADMSGPNETNTAEMIDQMFEEVLEAAGQMEDKGDGVEDHDSGIVPGSGEKSENLERVQTGNACKGAKEKDDTSEDEMPTFPPCGILSPLSKSVATVVTPMRLAAGPLSNPPSLLLSPDEDETPRPADSAPLYSIDAYRTQRQKEQPTIQSVTPVIQRRAQEKSCPQPSVNIKERIAGLNEEAAKLQTVISQTLQALSCCTDEGHGRGSLEEAEAERLLLVSCEKRSALLSEVARLKDSGSVEPEEGDRDMDYVTQHPCRGTVSISQVQLPLKVEFVCSSRNRTGRPSHYFFVLIRYGPYHIVATPLATALDALNGDTISFSTSVTLQDIRPSFEIDVEIYSLSHTSSSTSTVERIITKSRVTPRKILKTMKKSNPSSTSAAVPALITRRSSNFNLVGSHKITLASLGQRKFPLDKMKFEGKIRRLLGDEFQEKVPFLSPLEGNIYLTLDSHSHSNVQHQGFLTMFEVINGFGAWHRRFFVLEAEQMFYWNHPNDRGTKLAEGSISLSRTSSQSVKPVKRDTCARPFTFELVSDLQSQEHYDHSTKSKCWFSADTKEDRSDWMEKLNQVLLDLHTWTRRVLSHSDSEVSQTTSTSSSFCSTNSAIRESTI